MKGSVPAFLILLAYFLYFARGAVQSRFAPDDMMNLAGYWRRGWWPTLGDNLIFWSSAYRPMGGLFYLPLYRLFHLHPLPYHLVALAIVFAGIWLSFLVAEQLTKSWGIALVTGIIVCAQSTMASVYYYTSSIYDILSFFFCLLLLLIYIRIRDRGDIPTARSALLIVLLFIAALDSKEISVMMAAFVLAFELLFHGLPRRWTWLRKEGLIPTVLLALAVVYCLGKLVSPSSLAGHEGYRVVLSMDRYLDNNVIYGRAMLYRFLIVSRPTLIAADIALLSLLLFHRTAAVRWSAFYALAATLPISFIATRGGSSLLVPLFGWSLLLATLSASLWPQWRWARRLSLAALCLIFVQTTIRSWKDRPPILLRSQEQTWNVITQLQNLSFRPSPFGRVIVLNDPWERDWDMFFISELVWNEPSVQITLSRKLPAPPGPEDLARFDSVLEYTPEGRLRQVR